MGLFDRLFGKKEEPKIEDIVKEALENLDLSEEVEENQTAVEETAQEETKWKKHLLKKNFLRSRQKK